MILIFYLKIKKAIQSYSVSLQQFLKLISYPIHTLPRIAPINRNIARNHVLPILSNKAACFPDLSQADCTVQTGCLLSAASFASMSYLRSYLHNWSWSPH